jgi:hypothetical protein
MSFVTTEPEVLAWATENLQGVHRGAPAAIFDATQPANQPVEGQRIAQSRRGRDSTDRILTTSQLARHSASPRRVLKPLVELDRPKQTYSTGVCRVSMNHRGVCAY